MKRKNKKSDGVRLSVLGRREPYSSKARRILKNSKYIERQLI